MLFKIGSETIAADFIDHEMIGITEALGKITPKALLKIIIERSSYKEFDDLYANLRKKYIVSIDENGNIEKGYKLKKHTYRFIKNENDIMYSFDLFLEEL